MKLNYAPQAGLRRRSPGPGRERMAFWAGIAILIAFELILMAKSWSPASAALIFGYDADHDRSTLDQDASAPSTTDGAGPSVQS